MTGRLALRLLAAGLALAAIPSPARAQGCARVPRADAGPDVTECIPAVGTTDFTLSASRSVAQPLNGPIIEHCWTTDLGVFVPTGTDTACLSDTDVVLRVPNLPGNTRVLVNLLVTDAAGCSDDDQLLLDLSTHPVITRAQAVAPSVCRNEPLDLLASAVNTFDVQGLVEYRWDLDTSLDQNMDGDPANDPDIVLTGVSGNLVVASATPARLGRFTARLTVIAAGNPCVATRDVPYEVLAPPVVRLLVGPVTACPNQVATFQADLAFGDSSSDLTWDFDTALDSDGNGDPADDVQATGSTASFAWPEGGTYTLRVTAVGTNGCEGFTERQIVVRTAPVPAFTVSGPSCGNLAVTFTDRSTGSAPLSVAWDFGDGSPVALGASRTHVYSAPGTYAVAHFVTDAEGCLVARTQLVTVQPAAGRIEGVTILDGQPGTDSTGNADGFADPGERIRIAVDASNAGGITLTDLQATLISNEAAGLAQVVQPTSAFPILAAGAVGTTLLPHLGVELSPSIECGSAVPLEIRVASASSPACVARLPLLLRVGALGLQRLGQEVAVTGSPGRAEAIDAVGAGTVHAVLVLDETSGLGRARLVRVASNGVRLAGDLLVDDVPGQVRQGQVAWAESPGEFGVAWLAVESSSTTPGNVVARFRRVGAGLAPVGGSRRLDFNGRAGTTDVAWAGDHWLVAWTDRAPGAATAQLQVQVITSGGLLLGAPVALGAPVTDDGDVRLAAAGGRVLVAHRTGTELRLFTVEGLRPAMVVGQQALDGAAGIPSVARSGGGFLVAFASGAGIDVARLPLAGSTTRSTLVSTGTRPMLSAGPEFAALAWQDGIEILASVLGSTGRAAGARVIASPGVDAAERPVLSATGDGLFLAAFGVHVAGGVTVVRAAVLGPALPEGCASGLLGDVSPAPGGDGRVDVADVVLLLRAAVGLVPVTPEMLARGDVAPGERVGTEHRVIGDGVIDVADVVVLLQASTGLITIVP